MRFNKCSNIILCKSVSFSLSRIFREIITGAHILRDATIFRLVSWSKVYVAMHSARELHSAVRYAIRDISIPNISHKATPPRAVILNIIYVFSHTKRERESDRLTLRLDPNASSSPGACSAVCARADSMHERARRTKARARPRATSWFQSKNNIDPLFGSANKYHKYRPAELSALISHAPEIYRARMHVLGLELLYWRARACDYGIRMGIRFAPHWPFVFSGKGAQRSAKSKVILFEKSRKHIYIILQYFVSFIACVY